MSSLYIFSSSWRCQHLKLLSQKLRLSIGRATVMSSAQMEEKGPEWQEHKKKYLNLPIADKRKLYKCGENFYTLNDLKTWHEYILEYKQPLFPETIEMLPECKIDSSLNAEVAKKISVFRGDITTLEVDAIVNAANKSLLGGGGVDGAIHRAAGADLLAENKTHGGCNVGEVKLSGGYKLPAKYVISTVGPQGEKPDLLSACYRNAINLSLEKKLRSIAFPCISTGVYGYPLLPAAHVVAWEIRQLLEANYTSIDRVVFCLFSAADEETYHGVLQSYFPVE